MQGKRCDSFEVGIIIKEIKNILKLLHFRWHSFCQSLHANATLCVTDTFGKFMKFFLFNPFLTFYRQEQVDGSQVQQCV